MNSIKTHLISIFLIALCVSSARAQLQTSPFGITNAQIEKFAEETPGELTFDTLKDIADMQPTAQRDLPSVVQEPVSDETMRLYNLMKDERKYRNRAKTYGILGGVSLGLGAVLTTSGIIALTSNQYGNPAVDFGGIILTSTGGLFALGSVPLFVACHKQSVKAASVSAIISTMVTPGSTPSPGVGFSVNF